MIGHIWTFSSSIRHMTRLKIAPQVELYVHTHPAIQECLAAGLLNYSALARRIAKELHIPNTVALLAALQRLRGKLRRSEGHEARLRSLLRTARLQVTNRIAVVIIDRPRDMTALHELERVIRRNRGVCNVLGGDEVVTLILSEQYIEEARRRFSLRTLKVSRSLAQISLVFDERIESTAGVVAFVYGLLASRGVNILEEMSCWTDTLIVLREDDIPRALAALAL